MASAPLGAGRLTATATPSHATEKIRAASKNFSRKFGKHKKNAYLCIRNRNDGGIAQLVRASDS